MACCLYIKHHCPGNFSRVDVYRVHRAEPSGSPEVFNRPFCTPSVSSYIPCCHILSPHFRMLTVNQSADLRLQTWLYPQPTRLPTDSMPATYSQLPDRAWYHPKKDSTHAAIIVGVVIGMLGIIAILLFLWDRSQRHGLREGFRTKPRLAMPQTRGPSKREKYLQLEVGMVREPLPIYQRDSDADEGIAWVEVAGDTSATRARTTIS